MFILDSFDCGMCVVLYPLFGFFVFYILKGNLNDMPHVINHILNVAGGCWAVRINQNLLNPGVILRIYLVLGCPELVLNHIAFLSGCKNTLLGTG